MRPKFRHTIFASFFLCAHIAVAQYADVNKALAPPAQNQGLPYTTSAQASGLYKIRDQIAVMAGSRFAYLKEFRVHIDDTDPLHGEAMIKDGEVYVPASFAAYLTLKDFTPATPAPDYLKDRWVYTIARPDFPMPPGVKTIQVSGVTYVNLVDVARSLGKKISGALDCETTNGSNDVKLLPPGEPHALVVGQTVNAPNLPTGTTVTSITPSPEGIGGTVTLSNAFNSTIANETIIFNDPSGFVCVGDRQFEWGIHDNTERETVITQFDTPEKFADPTLPIKYIPRLRALGIWTERTSITPDQLALLNGPETKWDDVSQKAGDLSGFNAAILGSKPPPPGVYPRLLFSPNDLPAIQERIKHNNSQQMALIAMELYFKKNLWDTTTPDGQIFDQLANGLLENDVKVGDLANYLPAMALYCLLAGDDTHGKMAAAAIANYYKFLEVRVDRLLAMSDSEFGSTDDKAIFSTTQWQGMDDVVGHANIGLALDFAGKWMDDGQKEVMRRVIAKATYGRRINGGGGPVWAPGAVGTAGWDLSHLLDLAAIEGLEAFDADAYASDTEAACGFLEWGVDAQGQISGLGAEDSSGLQSQILAMIILARRGVNLWGSSHWRNLPTAQALATSPDGRETMNFGAEGFAAFPYQAMSEFKAFYPDNKALDWMFTSNFPGEDPASVKLDAYRARLELRSPGQIKDDIFRIKGFLSVLYDAGWTPTFRNDAGLPLDWSDDTRWMLSSSSSNTETAAWLCFNAGSGGFSGASDPHADAGTFFFSAFGAEFITASPFPNAEEGSYQSEVLIDGASAVGNLPSRVTNFSVNTNDNGSIASADLTYAYSWRWNTLVNRMSLPWELETSPDILALFKGTQAYKFRMNTPTYTFSSWQPIVRAPANTVQYVYRTAGMVRGNHPYAIIVDDAKKDESTRAYTWSAMLGEEIVGGTVSANLNAGAVLVRSSDIVENRGPRPGSPMLLVWPLAEPGKQSAKIVAKGEARDNTRRVYREVNIDVRGTAASYKILLIPMHADEPFPNVIYDAKSGQGLVKWPDQEDHFQFTVDDTHRTRVSITRNDQEILSSK